MLNFLKKFPFIETILIVGISVILWLVSVGLSILLIIEPSETYGMFDSAPEILNTSIKYFTPFALIYFILFYCSGNKFFLKAIYSLKYKNRLRRTIYCILLLISPCFLYFVLLGGLTFLQVIFYGLGILISNIILSYLLSPVFQLLTIFFILEPILSKYGKFLPGYKIYSKLFSKNIQIRKEIEEGFKN